MVRLPEWFGLRTVQEMRELLVIFIVPLSVTLHETGKGIFVYHITVFIVDVAGLLVELELTYIGQIIVNLVVVVPQIEGGFLSLCRFPPS